MKLYRTHSAIAGKRLHASVGWFVTRLTMAAVVVLAPLLVGRLGIDAGAKELEGAGLIVVEADGDSSMRGIQLTEFTDGRGANAQREAIAGAVITHRQTEDKEAETISPPSNMRPVARGIDHRNRIATGWGWILCRDSQKAIMGKVVAQHRSCVEVLEKRIRIQHTDKDLRTMVAELPWTIAVLWIWAGDLCFQLNSDRVVLSALLRDKPENAD